MDSDQQDEAGLGQSAGVFGNLPTSRPGTRSPRRRSSAAANQPPTTEPTAEAPSLDPIADAARVAAATAPRRKPEPSPNPAAPGREAEEADGTSGVRSGREAEEAAGGDSGLTDIAWAGVAVAADAATIGVRLASRALERLRDGVDPR